MKDSHRIRYAGALGAGLVLVLGILDATPAAAVQSAFAPGDPADAAPQLSIAIDDGHTSTTAGDSLNYVITIQNLGSTDVDGMLLHQSLPTGLTFGSADLDGVADADGVGWKLDLKVTETATFHTSMTVTDTPADLLRLATVACASTAADGPPIVCAAHSDELPAGAAAAVAAANQAALTNAVASATPERPWWYLPAGLALVVLLVGVLVYVLVIRQHRRQASEHESPDDFDIAVPSARGDLRS